MESDSLVAAEHAGPEFSTPERQFAPAPPAEHSAAVSVAQVPTRSEAKGVAEIPGMGDLTRPLVIPPIAVPEVAEPLPLSRLDRLDPSSKACLQPDQGADLLWHKV